MEGPLLEEHQDLVASRRLLLLKYALVLPSTKIKMALMWARSRLPFPSERRGKRDNLKWGYRSVYECFLFLFLVPFTYTHFALVPLGWHVWAISHRIRLFGIYPLAFVSFPFSGSSQFYFPGRFIIFQFRHRGSKLSTRVYALPVLW